MFLVLKKYIHAMEEAQFKIISTLIENKGQFDVPVEQRSRVHRTVYVKSKTYMETSRKLLT